MAREAQNFERGTNWKAKNAASIRLRSGDGKKHPVITTNTAPTLTGEARARAERIRVAEQDRIARQRQAREAAARGAARDAKAESRHADRGHTPDGWVPANRRGFRDPLSFEADPRPKAPLKKKKKKFRRGRRELQ